MVSHCLRAALKKACTIFWNSVAVTERVASDSKISVGPSCFCAIVAKAFSWARQHPTMPQMSTSPFCKDLPREILWILEFHQQADFRPLRLWIASLKRQFDVKQGYVAFNRLICKLRSDISWYGCRKQENTTRSTWTWHYQIEMVYRQFWKERLKPVSHVCFFSRLEIQLCFIVRPAPPPFGTLGLPEKVQKAACCWSELLRVFWEASKVKQAAKKSNQNHIYSMQPGLLNSCCSWLAALPFGVSLSLLVDAVAVVYAGWFILLPECWQTAKYSDISYAETHNNKRVQLHFPTRIAVLNL